MGAEETRARILNCTVELIKERGGDISNVTIRTIAERAGVGVGLTNHYFKSKELLVEECVNTVFKDLFAMFLKFNLPEDESDNPCAATKHAAQNVFNFLLNNEALARAAFEAEEKEPKAADYTTRMVNSFAFCMVDRRKLEEMLQNDRLSEKMKIQFREHFVNEQRFKAFTLVSTIKEAFLRRAILKDIIGIDINDKEQLSDYLDNVIENIM